MRLWTARLLCDAGKTSTAVAAKLAQRAEVEPEVEVRSQLACSAKRLPACEALPIVAKLIATGETPETSTSRSCSGGPRGEARDGLRYRGRAALFQDRATWELPIVKSTIEERLMRRLAAAGTRKDLDRCARLLALRPGPGTPRS